MRVAPSLLGLFALAGPRGLLWEASSAVAGAPTLPRTTNRLVQVAMVSLARVNHDTRDETLSSGVDTRWMGRYVKLGDCTGMNESERVKASEREAAVGVAVTKTTIVFVGGKRRTMMKFLSADPVVKLAGQRVRLLFLDKGRESE